MTRSFLTSVLMAVLAGPALSAAGGDPVSADLRPGYRMEDGTHMAALHLTLAPGWKTYWRAPGDAGIPPLFDVTGSQNVRALAPVWPAPEVFWQSGMRSVGYDRELVLPLRITPERAGADMRLKGSVEIGVCKDICLPHTLRFDAALPAGSTERDRVIGAALARRPFTETEAGVGAVTCRIAPEADGVALTVEAQIDAMPGEEAVIEVGNPKLWVSEPETRRQGRALTVTSDVVHVSGGPVSFQRDAVTVTVIGQDRAVEIRGCD